MERTTEKELAPLALAFIKWRGKEGASTSDLRLYFSKWFPFTEDDLKESTSHYGNYKWLQVVSNLKSNKTLEKTGLVTFIDKKFYYNEHK